MTKRKRRFVTSLPHTGHKCARSGTYRGTDSCHRIIRITKGTSFPPCHLCYKATSWRRVRRVAAVARRAA